MGAFEANSAAVPIIPVFANHVVDTVVHDSQTFVLQDIINRISHDIDVEKAEAHEDADKKYIIDLINSQSGVDEFNQVLRNLFWHKFMKVTTAAYSRGRTSTVGLDAE